MLHRWGEDGTYGWRPNIVGTVYGVYGLEFTVVDGAYSISGTLSNTNRAGVNPTPVRAVYFNASQSNSIYTANGHVYPLSLALNFIIKA